MGALHQQQEDDDAVSYKKIPLLDDTDWIDDIGKSVNITRAYTNPMNGEQSLAFCDLVELSDPESKKAEPAVLIRRQFAVIFRYRMADLRSSPASHGYRGFAQLIRPPVDLPAN